MHAFGATQVWTEINSLELAFRLGFGTQRGDCTHAVLAANPTGDSALIDTQLFGGLGLRLEVGNQVSKDVHLSPSYGNTHILEHGNTRLQGYGRTRNTGRMEFKDRLKLARRHGKLTQTELATAVGISQTSITDLERGKSQSTSYVAEIAKACSVDPLWLATGRGDMVVNLSMANVSAAIQPHKDAKEYPLISWVIAGGWQESCDSFQPGDADEWLESNANAGQHGYWLEVKGLSMVAQNDTVSFPPGMRILVQPEGFDLVSGKFYIAKMETGETTFKQYIRDAGVEYLQPLNPSFKTLEIGENVRIIGRVIDAKLPKALF